MDDLAHSMDFCSINNHLRTIIHIDIDCFYAQVEMIKNPALRQCPLGIQQKNIIVTSNYKAREYGIQKCMLVSEGLKLCPELVLVRGEDLSDYRQMSNRITHLLNKFSPQVEKLGLDENFVDVTSLVAERLGMITDKRSVEGNLYGDLSEKCECGCRERLCLGSSIACEMRSELKNVLGITTCAGVAHNKLLAKLVCATHKPNQQTTVFPCNSLTLISSLENVRGIPGIGHRMYETLQSVGISTIKELQNCNLTSLQKVLGNEMAVHVKKLCYGIDDSVVKQTGKPQSIGLEDGFKKISFESEVKDKLATLLQRLLKLLSQDGRIPGSIRVTVRKYDGNNKFSHRESRQCNVAASFFVNMTSRKANEAVSPKSNEKLMTLIMQLFQKMVNISKPFHLTLLGLAFTKFQERKTGKSSIASFLTNDISVQSVMSFKSGLEGTEKMEYSSICSSSPINIERSGSESEAEPSPKKSRSDLWLPRCKKRFSSEEDEVVPSKRLSEDSGDSIDNLGKEDVFNTTSGSSDLQVNFQDIAMEESASGDDRGTKLQVNDCRDSNSLNFVEHQEQFQCPNNVDADVFHALPPELKSELMEAWTKGQTETSPVSQHKQISFNRTTPKQKSILHYFISNK